MKHSMKSISERVRDRNIKGLPKRDLFKKLFEAYEFLGTPETFFSPLASTPDSRKKALQQMREAIDEAAHALFPKAEPF